MYLDKKHYSFCSKMGLMKENYSKEQALKSIKKSVAETKKADPKFIELVQGLTLSSSEVEMRVCALYHYTADVDYVVGGMIKSTKINDFGYSGAPDSLYITSYKDGGTYTTITDPKDIPYDIFNDHNLFTLDSMKNALTNAIGKALPSSYTSFQSKSWDVSVYFVPVLTVVVKFGKETYAMNYNLHNGRYHWEYPDNPALVKKGTRARSLRGLFKFAGFVLNIVAIIMGIVNMSNNDASAGAFLVPALFLILNIFLHKKSKHTKAYFKKLFIKNPNKKFFPVLMPAIFNLIIGLIALIVGKTF